MKSGRHMNEHRMKRHVGLLYLAGCLCLAMRLPCGAQDTVDISLPAAVTFVVGDISASTDAVQNPTQVSYSNFTGTNLRISIKAENADFTRPIEDGGYIHANLVSWTCTGCGPGGTTHNGSLQGGSYVDIYDGTAASNSFDITWTLATITEAVHAGDHSLTSTWKIESL